MRRAGLLAATLIATLSTYTVARADLPGRHPFYLHALSDLRSARWLLEHRPGDAMVSTHEDIAIQAIDRAINEIRRASIDDGKDLRDHPQMDVPGEHGGRLHRAVEILRRVHSDVAREEDDPASRGLRNRAVGNVDEAIHQTEAAIFDIEHHR